MRWSVEYVAAIAFCVLLAILGGLVLVSASGPMKTRDDDRTGRWEDEYRDRQQKQFAGGVLFALGCAGSCVAYVESFKAAVRKLNPITERSADEVVGVFGPPSVTINPGDGTTRFGWKRLWYSIALAFKDGKCVGVVAEGNL